MKIIQATGQTCNQFWIYSNHLADAIEKNEKFAIWVPDLSFKDFPNLLNSENILYPLYNKNLLRIYGFRKYTNLINFLFNNKITLKLLEYLINNYSKHSFKISNVNVKKSEFKLKHLNKIMNSFLPGEMIRNSVQKTINNIKTRNTLIIGIHFRRGDYRTFQNGKYYYSNSQYASFMRQLIKLFCSESVAFLLISNEEIDRSFFVDYNCYFSSSNLMAEDLFLLSQTDYILGPPSTFSAWASLYKNSPLHFIEDADSHFTINEFTDIKSIWF
jgi:hypothetical protein